jgi:hypothetical protein
VLALAVQGHGVVVAVHVGPFGVVFLHQRN